MLVLRRSRTPVFTQRLTVLLLLLVSTQSRHNMARWYLREKHYLNVPGTEWEYKETDRETQRQVRKVFEVPLYLNPDEPADWNDRVNERIIVSTKFDPASPRDYVFIGSPTPDMIPLDEEAQGITDDFVRRGVWKHPIESLDMN